MAGTVRARGFVRRNIGIKKDNATRKNNGATFGFAAVHIIPTIMLRESILKFWKQLKTGSNSYQDHLVYRQFKILGTLTNFVHKRCLGVFIRAIVLTLNLGILIGISNGAQKETKVVMIAAFLIMTLDCVPALLAMLGGMVLAYTES